MTSSTDDLRITDLRELIEPQRVMSEFARSEAATRTVISTRAAIHDILVGSNDRMIAIVGPCSIHDPKAALDYAARLMEERERHKDTLEIVMRVYFEKPRTTVGWKGLINDPELDGSFDINNGLRLARELLNQINSLGMPAAVEFLDMTTPQYFGDLVAWGAIGARTTESQVHRELASGLSCPVGFKNGTNGNVRIAIDAVKSASNPHHFLAVTKSGKSGIATTAGNGDCHIILRGGSEPNYDAESVDHACQMLKKAGEREIVMVDASHANSKKNHENQPRVFADIAGQVAGGERRIIGVMAESNLVAGRQDLKPGVELTYGQSITDACVGWDTTIEMLDTLAAAVATRRTLGGTPDRALEEIGK